MSECDHVWDRMFINKIARSGSTDKIEMVRKEDIDSVSVCQKCHCTCLYKPGIGVITSISVEVDNE